MVPEIDAPARAIVEGPLPIKAIKIKIKGNLPLDWPFFMKIGDAYPDAFNKLFR